MKRTYLLILAIVIIVSCKKPYLPPVVNSTTSYLVVEGVINTADSTVIKLSHTVNIGNNVTANPLAGATVAVQNDQNAAYPLTERFEGTYVLTGVKLDNTHKYRLSIKTADNKQYLSDFVAVNVTPPIDSIGFTTGGNKLQIYLNTHDPNNNTHYYRWDYTETWQFHAEYLSGYVASNGKISVRTPPQLIYSCYGNDSSSTILLGSSAKLAQDVIYQSPITAVVSSSEKVESKYSILIHEYALTSDAYTFWTNLKKNTEQLGSIFDAQPSEISGNVHNVANAAEPVIGYISACAVQSKRIFITSDQLPYTWTTIYPYECSIDSNFYSRQGANEVQENLLSVPPVQLILDPFYLTSSPTPTGYLGTASFCADCTLRGTIVKPSFWK
jgi:hypothetical protein